MAGHVYLIGSRKFHWFKIGKSNNAAIRIADLGILLPFRIEIIAVWKVANHHLFERLLHEKYQLNRINGEWFTFGDQQLDKIVEDIPALKVQVAEGFTNLPVNAPEVPLPPRNMKGGWQKRMDKLIREKRELEKRLEASTQVSYSN